MTSKFLIILLCVALIVVSVRLYLVTNNSCQDTQTSMSDTLSANDDFYDVIMSRASVRSYLDKPVEDEKIDKLLHAAMAAPTAIDKRPWHFIVVTEKEMLKKLADASPNAKMVATAPLAVVVCGDMSKENDDWTKDFWIQDVSAASENMLLQAHAMGLGGVWTAIWPSVERGAAVSSLLETPEHIIPFATLVFGYPSSPSQPKDKWDEFNVSYELYGE